MKAQLAWEEIDEFLAWDYPIVNIYLVLPFWTTVEQKLPKLNEFPSNANQFVELSMCLSLESFNLFSTFRIFGIPLIIILFLSTQVYWSLF